MSPRRARPQRRSRASSSGFGLLEAVVALTLLAGSGLALFGWINQNLQAATRLRIHEQETRQLLSAQSLIETVNPILAPNGRLEVGGLAVNWESEPLAPPRRNAAFGEGVSGVWRVGLYRLRVHAQDRTKGVDLRFEQWRVGTQRIQPATEVLPP